MKDWKLVKSANHYRLPKNYLALLNSKNTLVLTVMGRDPYPTDPIGIPFCKPTWKLMCKGNVSGWNVLCSLGVNIKVVKRKYTTPKEFFYELANIHGIAFLNLSYHFLGSNQQCRKRRHKYELIYAEKINRLILRKSKRVIFCGEAKKHSWYGEKHKKGYEVCHPDTRCKISQFQSVRQNWKEWWSPKAISKKFGMKI